MKWTQMQLLLELLLHLCQFHFTFILISFSKLQLIFEVVVVLQAVSSMIQITEMVLAKARAFPSQGQHTHHCQSQSSMPS